MVMNNIRFSQDIARVAVSREAQWAIYHCDPFDCIYTESKPASIVEQLFSTSLVAVVDNSCAPQQNVLRIVNTSKHTTICELSYESPIIDVSMNRKRLVVVLEDKLLLYDVSCMKLLDKIDIKVGGNYENNRLECRLSQSDSSILAYQQPHPELSISDHLLFQSGNVILLDAIKSRSISIVNCHEASIEKIALSKNGMLLATASTKGTIIRIFSTQTSKKLCEFRRGSLPATITSLSFSTDHRILGASSDTGTVHFFEVPNEVALLGEDDEGAVLESSPKHVQEDLDMRPEFPNSSPLTAEEALEINQLIGESIHRARGSVGKNKSALEKTKQLTSFMWAKSSKYLPQSITTSLTSMLEPKRHFASIHLHPPSSSTIALSDHCCYVATNDGRLLQYALPSPETSSKEPALIRSNSFQV